MKKNNQHILQQVNIEINATSETKAFELKSNIDSFMKEELFPSIELLFDDSVTPEEIRRFESIDLEVQMHPSDNLGVIKDQLIDQLHEKIDRIRIEFDRSDASNPETDVRHTNLSSKDQLSNLKGTFLYFLETGQLPWYAIPALLSEFTQPIHFNESLQDKYFLLKLKQLFSSNRIALKRFIQQFDDEIITGLITQFSKESRISFDKLRILISGQNKATKELFYILIINNLIQEDFQISREQWSQLQGLILKNQLSETMKKRNNEIQEILHLAKFDLRNFKTEPETIHSEVNEQKRAPNSVVVKQEMTETEATDKSMELNPVYIRNAGLILTHPFLRTLFTRTNCTNEKGDFLNEKQTYAIHLLHYLSTGQEHGMEHELTFEKFLCGVPLDAPIDRKVELSDEDKMQCIDLLKAMISNWSALKNTSPEGLRQTFILRNGKLDLQKSPSKLFVERKAFDILLNKLPWSISVVKLPWMNDFIFVEW